VAREVEDLASAVAHGPRCTVQGQSHGVDQVVLAPILAEFFSEGMPGRIGGA